MYTNKHMPTIKLCTHTPVYEYTCMQSWRAGCTLVCNLDIRHVYIRYNASTSPTNLTDSRAKILFLLSFRKRRGGGGERVTIII